MQLATACAISFSSLSVPSFWRSSLWSEVKRTPRLRVHCVPTTDPNLPEPKPLELKPLPYSFNALEPHISKETVEYHWERHHKCHVDSLNAIIKGTEFAGMELEDMVLASYNKGKPLPCFSHASLVWNHDFFWEAMKPGGGGNPSGILKDLIERDFGSVDALAKEIQSASLTQFGSGWVWIAYKAHRLGVGNDINPRPSEKDKRLVVTKTPNAITPLVWDYYPLLAIDVWEHAYYMDYENRREEYVSVILDKLVSWDVLSSRLENAMERERERELKERLEMLRKQQEEEAIKVKYIHRRPKSRTRKRRPSSSFS